MQTAEFLRRGAVAGAAIFALGELAACDSAPAPEPVAPYHYVIPIANARIDSYC